MSLTEYANYVFKPLNPFLEEGLLDKKSTDKLKRLEYHQFDNILNTITGQKSINDMYYHLYKIDLPDKNKNIKLNYCFDIFSDNKNEYPNILQVDSENGIDYFILKFFSPSSIERLLSRNKDQKNIFIQFNYSGRDKDNLHQAAIMLNTIEKTVYLLDPNGQPDYFMDKLTKKEEYTNTINIVDNILNEIFKNIGYEYLPMTFWNNEKHSINRKFSDSVIGEGHCVIITILLIHYIMLTEFDPKTIYDLFGNLLDPDLLHVINSYSLTIYKMLFY